MFPQALVSGLFLHSHRNLHPLLVHFPIVLFCCEAVCLTILQLRKDDPFWKRLSKLSLYTACASALPVVLTGFYDSGLDQQAANPLIVGIQERFRNATKFEDPVSLHFAYAISFIILSLVRLGWRLVLEKETTKAHDRLFLMVTVFGLWLLFATAQAGGVMSHP